MLRHVGARNLLWGTDMPFQNRFCTYRQSRRWIETCGLLSADELAQVMGAHDGAAARHRARERGRLGACPSPAGPWSSSLPPIGRSTAGSKEALVDAIGRGADLRIYTEFLYEEHILPGGGDDRTLDGLIREVIDFRETILVDGPLRGGDHDPAPAARAAARLQRPRSEDVVLPVHDGRRAGAGQPRARRRRRASVAPGERTVVPTPADMPKMGLQEYFDLGTTGPSRNFVYDMEVYRYFVRDEWTEVLAHDADGRVTAGSFAALEEAQIAGREIKVGIRDLGADLAIGGAPSVTHEVVHARRVGLRPRPGRAVRHAHPPARPRSRRRDPAALPVRELGRRVGLPAHRRPGAGPPHRPVHQGLGGPPGAVRLPLVRTVIGARFEPPDPVRIGVH